MSTIPLATVGGDPPSESDARIRALFGELEERTRRLQTSLSELRADTANDRAARVMLDRADEVEEDDPELAQQLRDRAAVLLASSDSD